eukprot:5814250-Pleurochrysis_carterae.AAC.1
MEEARPYENDQVSPIVDFTNETIWSEQLVLIWQLLRCCISIVQPPCDNVSRLCRNAPSAGSDVLVLSDSLGIGEESAAVTLLIHNAPQH